MDQVISIINQAIPWLLLVVLLFFTMIIVSYVYGLFKARKVDDSLRLALNTKGKIVFGLLYGVYILCLVNTIAIEIKIFSSSGTAFNDKITLALNATNLLTVLTFLGAIELQDIFFIGKKNILIGSQMFEIRRMRKMAYPKKYQMSFIYGQKQYTFSTRFIDIPTLKSKFTKLK